MEQAAKSVRLVAFLGTGNYQQTVYQWGGSEQDGHAFSHASCYATEAICQMLLRQNRTVDQVRILCTDKAWETHGIGLSEAIRKVLGKPPTPRSIPDGKNQKELWQQFQILREEFRVPEGLDLVLDITSGFRSGPFFAAAALSFCRAVDEYRPQVEVYYAGNLGGTNIPIWNITSFISLVDWAQALSLFLKTGRVTGVVEPTEELGRALAKEWARRGKTDEKPGLDRLAKAIKRFGEDLATIRTGSLLIGDCRKESSANALLGTLKQTELEVQEHVQPLADVMGQIREFVEPMTGVQDLKTPEGERALAELAGLYLKMQRYAEAITTVREAWVTRFAESPGTRPGTSGCLKAREKAEEAAREADTERFRTIANLRNDINHGGMNHQPNDSEGLIKQVRREVELLKQRHDNVVPSAPDGPTIFLNLSNHASDDWESAQREAALALATQIMDLPFPAVPPDATTQDIETMACDLVKKVPQNVICAMVQGEFTLTYALIQKLEARKVKCLAATSQRDVEVSADGTRTGRFRFVQLRAYRN